MRKLKKDINTPAIVMNETIENFFERGKITAKLLDQKERISSRRVISFESFSDLVRLLTKNKLKLVSIQVQAAI